jgi:hypothetical protein
VARVGTGSTRDLGKHLYFFFFRLFVLFILFILFVLICYVLVELRCSTT